MVAVILLLGACSKEMAFKPDGETGQILRSALAMDIRVDALEHLKLAGTRAGEVSPDDFTVAFTLAGHSSAAATYKYGEMPEVITLPVGTYTCTAYYGEDRAADWDNPRYVGTSEAFEVSAYEITSYIEPIECRLDNVQVSIEFDPMLMDAMSEDSYVEVKVGDVGSLNFGLAEAKSGKCGFFRHTAESTLVAVFNGDVNGVRTVESKSMSDIEKGNHYRILFKLHNHNGTDSGDSDANVAVDASVTVTDVELGVDTIEDEVLDDDERPTEDGDDPTPPGPQDPEGDLPELTVTAPFQFDTPSVFYGGEVPEGLECVIEISSSADNGIEEFECQIISDLLTPDVLEGIGLSDHLNLAQTPPEMAEVLQKFHFPVNVRGLKSARMDLSSFVPLMAGLGSGKAEFRLMIKDANGTVTKSLILEYK